MKRLLIISAILLTAVSVQGQTTVITGCIADSLTRAGEPAAILQFFKDEDTSKPIAYTTTDDSGHFTQVLSTKGAYRMLFSNIGRKQRSIGFFLEGQDTLDLGTILVEDDVQTLEAGSITAQKTLVQMDVDKITYKIEDDVDSKTSTVLEMLRKVPMVSVDGQDNITVNGSSSFQVYVDGKPNQMISSNPGQILKMMPASVIKDIEVVTDPGAKYDAEGVGGVLNLTTNLSMTGGKSISEGQYANVTLQGTTRGFGGGIYYSMQKGKLALSINGNASKMYMGETVSDMERIQKYESGDFITRTVGEADIKMPFYMCNMNMSYEIDSLNLITAGAGWFGNDMSYVSPFEASFTSPMMNYEYGGSVLTEQTTNSVNANVDYQHTWAGRPERSLVISYRFSGTPSSNVILNRFDPQKTEGIVMADRRTDGFTNSLSHTAQADFSTPLGSGAGHIINVGAKFTAYHNLSDQSNFIFDGNDHQFTPEGSLEYDFYNNIGAIYAEYDGKFGQFGIKAGARYEHTLQEVNYPQGEGQDFDLNYGNLVPMASLQYNIGQQQNVGLSYNMRISRPGITYLNPFVDNISDPTAKTYGNPDLKAEMGHTLSAIYNYFSPEWIVSLTLRQGFTGNGISQYSFYDDEHKLNTTYGNVVSTSTSGLNAFVTWIPGKKTRIIFNGGGSWTDIRSEALSQSNSGWTYNLLLGVQQTLPWDLRLSANAIASGRTVTLQGYSSGMLLGTLGLTKSFLDDRLSLSINGVSHLTGGRTMKVESVSQTKDFISRTDTGVPLRQISLSLSFSFGKQDNAKVKSAKKKIQNDTEHNQKSVAESLGTMMQM